MTNRLSSTHDKIKVSAYSLRSQMDFSYGNSTIRYYNKSTWKTVQIGLSDTLALLQELLKLIEINAVINMEIILHVTIVKGKLCAMK